jgi:hypothetical protein
MSLSMHDIVRGLAIGIPMLFIGLWKWSQRRRAKENDKTSSILRRRTP